MLMKPDPRLRGPEWVVAAAIEAEAEAGETGAGELATDSKQRPHLDPKIKLGGRSIWPAGQETHSRSDRRKSHAPRRQRKNSLAVWSASFKNAILIGLTRPTTTFPLSTRTATSQKM